jgi:hypothetical protein
VHAEQSIGDTIQFIRFIPLVLRRGGKVIVECQASLRRLFQDQWGVQQWLIPDDPMPDCDVYCPLLSLPLALGATPQSMAQSMPADGPYLTADARRREIWRSKLSDGGAAGGVKAGLVWAGNPSEPADPLRSLSLGQYSPLANIQGVRFVSLQKGWAAGQARDSKGEIVLTDFTDELSDFADTAALIAELDLVITVDTAVAHLAGALGKPVWTLLPYAPHWRWLLKGQTTPWYPTMRLFRQATRGEWGDVVGLVADELAQVVAAEKSLAEAGGNP